MLKLKKKNIWIYFIIVIAIYFSFLYFQTNSDYNILINEEKLIKEQIELEKEKKEELGRADKSVSSQETIESLARSDLNYLKDNETLFIDGEKANWIF